MKKHFWVKLTLGPALTIFVILSAFWLDGCKSSKPDPKPPAPPAVKLITGKTVKPVMSIGRHSFMSGAVLSDGTLLGGTYSFPSATSIIRSSKGRDYKVDAGESIFDMDQIGPNKVLVSTEGSRGIKGAGYHLDLKTGKFNKLYSMARGKFTGAFGSAIIDGKQVIVGGSEMRVNGKKAHKWDARYYVKHAFKFQGKYYIVGYDTKRNRGGWFVSSKLTGGYKWKYISGMGKARPMFGIPRPDGKVLALVGFSDYTGGYYRGHATAWIYKQGKLHKVASFKEFDFSSHCHWFDGQLLMALTKKWKGNKGPSGLASYANGKARVIARFDEPEARMVLKAKDGSAIVWTRWDKVRGRAYKVY